MDDRINRIATIANLYAYNHVTTREYIDGAPHVKHAVLRSLYSELVIQVFDFAYEHTHIPIVLDLGAGEGLATLPFLELGAEVTAVDISSSQLNALRNRCKHFGDRLQVRCEDIADALQDKRMNYDIIVANSFLHHIPDYMNIFGDAIALLNPWGQFFSFQDPLRYDSLGIPTYMFSTLAYFFWRIFKGDVLGGIQRRLRRKRKIYLAYSVHDNAEYHVTRNGVDQDAIYMYFKDQGFDCNIVRYFSTQNNLFQSLGKTLGVKNTFALIARRQ